MHDFQIALINPNTNVRTTDAMVTIAREAARQSAASASIQVKGYTACTGADMIVDMAALQCSGAAVASIISKLADDKMRTANAVVISAFGDPALEQAMASFPDRAFGIGTESMRAAAEGARRFAVATTTPGLQPGIDGIANRLGLESQYCGTFFTRSNPLDLATDPTRQRDELAEVVQVAVDAQGAEAVIIGGGPLAVAARELASRAPCPLIEPIPEAIRSAIRTLVKTL